MATLTLAARPLAPRNGAVPFASTGAHPRPEAAGRSLLDALYAPALPGVELRRFHPADAPAVAALSEAVYGEQHATAAEWRHAAQPREGARQYVVESGSGEPVAYGCLWTEPWLEHRGRRRLELLVNPGRRGCGLGSALYDRLLWDFRISGTPVLDARVALDQVEALRFLQRRRFVEAGCDWNLRLDVRQADLSGLAEAVERVEAQGITLTTLARDCRENPEWRADFHALFSMVEAEQADPEPSEPPPFGPFVAWLERQAETFDGCFLAKQGKRLVGISMLTRRGAQAEVLFQNATGTQRGFRGRGIATALKLQGIAYAREHGCGEIITTNTCRQAAILALNEKLGFRRCGGWATLERRRVP